MDTTKKKAGITIVCVALVAALGAGAPFTAGASADGIQQARKEADPQLEELVKEASNMLLEKIPVISAASKPTKLIGVKMSDESKFRPEEWKDILQKVESGEIALEDESSIGPTKSRQTINVSVESLESGEYVCLGQYTIKKGDIIKYNITAENSGILDVGFSPTAGQPDNNEYLGHAGTAGSSVIIANKPFIFKNSLSGTYYLWISYAQFHSLNNIEGTIEIAEQ